mgnify:CR=1 FL=1
MKRFILILAILAFVSANGQGVFDTRLVKTNAGSSTWSIVTTADDTSEVISCYPYMSTTVWGNVSTGNLDLAIRFQVNPDQNLSDSTWTTIKTITLTTKNVAAFYQLTATPIPVAVNARYIVTGNAGNGANAAYLKILHSGWTLTRRN